MNIKQPRSSNTSATKNVGSVKLKACSARLQEFCEDLSIGAVVTAGVPSPHQKPMLCLCEKCRVFYAEFLRWVSGNDTRDNTARTTAGSTNTPGAPSIVPAYNLVLRLEDTQKVSV